jgi:hypothetical protein
VIDFSKLSGSVSLRTSTLAAAAVMALTVSGMASAAGPTRTLAGAGISGKMTAPGKSTNLAILYDQTDLGDGNAITSQNFEASFDVYDNQAADDFTVPAGVKWQITKVAVTGQYSLAGPLASANVTFYKKKSGLPDKVVKTYPGVAVTDSAGSLVITVPKTTLKPGNYFVSVQGNMDFSVGGQWYWGIRTAQAGSPAAWQNPGDGFASGCTTWGVMATCISQTSPDMLFRLEGKSKPL